MAFEGESISRPNFYSFDRLAPRIAVGHERTSRFHTDVFPACTSRGRRARYGHHAPYPIRAASPLRHVLQLGSPSRDHSRSPRTAVRQYGSSTDMAPPYDGHGAAGRLASVDVLGISCHVARAP